ncbi:MAG: hydroxyethylthiazole kinase, partial [Bacteroidota bacterium]
DTHQAAVAAMAIMGIAGDMAAAISKGSGSFQMNFLDSLHQLSAEMIEAKIKLDA